MGLLIDLFGPSLFDFIKAISTPKNKAVFDRKFTNLLKQFKDFNALTRGFQGFASPFIPPGQADKIFRGKITPVDNRILNLPRNGPPLRGRFSPGFIPPNLQ